MGKHFPLVEKKKRKKEKRGKEREKKGKERKEGRPGEELFYEDLDVE